MVQIQLVFNHSSTQNTCSQSTLLSIVWDLTWKLKKNQKSKELTGTQQQKQLNSQQWNNNKIRSSNHSWNPKFKTFLTRCKDVKTFSEVFKTTQEIKKLKPSEIWAISTKRIQNFRCYLRIHSKILSHFFSVF